MDLTKEIPAWIKKEVEKACKKGVVVGLSGGIDSAVVARLAQLAFGHNVLGVLMPCDSHTDDEKHAIDFAKKFKIRTEKIELGNVFNELIKLYPKGNDLAIANLKPRLRMMTLYYFANIFNYVVAGTGNKSELLIGYFTKYGDGGVDILPIADLYKRDVRKLASGIGIPTEIIERPPSAGLWRGQTDEEEIGLTYENLDAALEAIEKGNEKIIDKKILEKVKKMMAISEHKRKSAPIFKLGENK